MTTQSTAEWKWEQIFNAKNLRRPANLARAEIRLISPDVDVPEDDPVGHFQRLIDDECAKPEFFDNAGAIPGLWVTGTNFLEERARVMLYSTKRRLPSDDWIQVSCVQAGPT